MQWQLQIKITYRRTLKVVKENYKRQCQAMMKWSKKKLTSLLLLHKVNLIIINPQRELHPIQSTPPPPPRSLNEPLGVGFRPGEVI
jgi:hypothetical protein